MWEQSASDWEWLRTNPGALAKHAGRWICVADGQIVVSEADDRVFRERLQRDGLATKGALIMRVPPVPEWQELEVQSE